MPFTFSHPAAIIPLKKKWPWLNISALVIGSIIPDFGYYFPLNEYFKENAHTPIRLITFCLPIGLVIFFLTYLLKSSFFQLLPNAHRLVIKSFNTEVRLSPRSFFAVLFSILVGAITHLFWDEFTHQTGWFVKEFTFLRYPVVSIGTSDLFLFNFLQHFSTLLGAILILMTYRSWFRKSQSLSQIQKYDPLIEDVLNQTNYSDSHQKHRLKNDRAANKIHLNIYQFWIGLTLISAIASVYFRPATIDILTFSSVRFYGFHFVIKFLRIFITLLVLVLIFMSVQNKCLNRLRR